MPRAFSVYPAIIPLKANPALELYNYPMGQQHLSVINK